jgi:hypothetical protein
MQKKIDEITKYCPACEQSKPLKSFYRLSTSKDGRATRCKRCIIDKVKIFKGEQKTKAKSMHLRTYDEIIDLKGVTRNDIYETYLALQRLGYNVCEDIHLQFCEKHNLPYKKKKWRKPRIATVENLGLC